VLQWAREHGCPWDSIEPWGEGPCQRAAGGGHLDVLQWARQHDCPWDWKSCAEAAGAEHFEVLHWVLENGCPWNEYT